MGSGAGMGFGMKRTWRGCVLGSGCPVCAWAVPGLANMPAVLRALHPQPPCPCLCRKPSPAASCCFGQPSTATPLPPAFPRLLPLHSVLLKDSFVESFPPRDRPFMRQFAETQMFSVYCDAAI